MINRQSYPHLSGMIAGKFGFPAFVVAAFAAGAAGVVAMLMVLDAFPGAFSVVSSTAKTAGTAVVELGADTAAAARNRLSDCSIKGNVSVSNGQKIYHMPGQRDYDSTIIRSAYGERWFCSEAEAQALGGVELGDNLPLHNTQFCG